MFLQLDERGPRYLQLARALKQAILDGRCAAATRLPATRVLARELALSRNTVLAAYEQQRRRRPSRAHARWPWRVAAAARWNCSTSRFTAASTAACATTCNTAC